MASETLAKIDRKPCVWCEDEWPPAVLDERTRLCPACRMEIVDRQVAESQASGPPEGVEEARRRVLERRRREFEEARARLAERGGLPGDPLRRPAHPVRMAQPDEEMAL